MIQRPDGKHTLNLHDSKEVLRGHVGHTETMRPPLNHGALRFNLSPRQRRAHSMQHFTRIVGRPARPLYMRVLRAPAVTFMAALFSIGVIRATDFTVAELFHRAEQLPAQGRYAEAEPLYKEALATDDHVLGPDRPEIIPVLNALADLYHVQGRDREATEILDFPRHLGIHSGGM